jgi:hypothetical protein
MTFAWDIIECPQGGCDAPAESVPMYQSMNPTGFGLVIHRRVFCVAGHVTFTEQGPDGQEAPPSTFTG